MGLAVEAGVSAPPNGSAESAPADAEWGLSGGGLPGLRRGGFPQRLPCSPWFPFSRRRGVPGPSSSPASLCDQGQI